MAIVFLLLPSATPLIAGGGDDPRKVLPTPSETQVNYAKRALQGFEMRYWLSNQLTLGQQAWDGNIYSQSPPVGLEYPRDSWIEHLFGAGPWIGAIVDGSRRVTMGYESSSGKYFRPDPRHPARELIWKTSIDEPGVPNHLGVDDDGDGSIDEDDLDGLDNDGDWVDSTDDVGSDGIPDSLETGCKGGYDAVTNPDPAFDNYERLLTDLCHPDANGNFRKKDDPDLYTEKNATPDHGEPNVDEDYGAMSENDLYCSAQDDIDVIDNIPLHARVTQRSFSWHTGTAADAVSILEYTFRNVGTSIWVDPYFAMFADADVGPMNVSAFYNDDCSCYIDSVRTAYAYDSRDPEITPVGVSLLGASTPIDSLGVIFRWFDFSSSHYPPSGDSALYGVMNGESLPGMPIAPCQARDSAGDTRFVLSAGPFDAVPPGESVTITYALVSAESRQLLGNAGGRASRILAARGFTPPSVRMTEGGNGSVTIAWDSARSPFGAVASYTLYFGTAPGAYTDSVQSTGFEAQLDGLQDSAMYYFSVAATDEHGNRGALSDELSRAPLAPPLLVAAGEQRAIDLRWSPSHSPDVIGYNVYRAAGADSSASRLNTTLITDTLFRDNDVTGEIAYRYAVSSMNSIGFESGLSMERSARLIPPAVPGNFVVGSGTDFIRLEWDLNIEDDFAGYTLSRISGTDTVGLITSPSDTTEFTDTAVDTGMSYTYVLEAMDSSGASTRIQGGGRLVVRDRGILVLLDICYPLTWAEDSAFAAAMFGGYQVTFRRDQPSSYLSPYSTVVWISDCMEWRYYPNRQPPAGLRAYVVGGGRLLVMGPGMTAKAYPNHFGFLDRLFDLSRFLGISDTADFIGATGTPGYPGVNVDSSKLAAQGGRAKLVETFPGIPPERVLYTYRSDPVDSSREGKPVGIRAASPERTAYYFSFPLYYLDSAGAIALTRKVMDDFGEVLVVSADDPAEIPALFRLYDPYPNPFNPATTIRFDVPVRSLVRLSLYDVLGRELPPLLEEDLPPGTHELRWDASAMASGVYYVRMTFERGDGSGRSGPGFRKMILVK